MTLRLQALIRDASMELGSDACRAGKHQWSSEGGRSCPHDLTESCSQAVYRCLVCGAHDYGDAGGPGHADCERHCKLKSARAVALIAARRDPFDLAWWSFATGLRYHRMLLRALRRQRRPLLP